MYEYIIVFSKYRRRARLDRAREEVEKEEKEGRRRERDWRRGSWLEARLPRVRVNVDVHVAQSAQAQHTEEDEEKEPSAQQTAHGLFSRKHHDDVATATPFRCSLLVTL